MSTLTVTTRNSNGVAILDFVGRITIGDSALILRDAVRKASETSSRIVLNLAQVSYVDSAGLGELVGCHTAMLNRRGAMKLANANARLSDLFKITRLQTLFEIHPSEKAAVESFGVPA
jgi:anti-sigma B factor antagonist